MASAVTCIRSVRFVKSFLVFSWRNAKVRYSTHETIPLDKPPLIKQRKKRSKTYTPSADLSWEERLSDAVTPLWRLSYEEQLELKRKRQETILSQLLVHLTGGRHSPSDKLNFALLPVLPSPVREGYRNKSTFSVNIGTDGNPKTVGMHVGTWTEKNIVCVNANHLLNMPERHKLVASCYEEFIRRSPLDPCLVFHKGGHWREVTVRTNAKGHTMAIVYFHPQMLTPEEVAVHKVDLVDYFTHGPGSVCQLDSLFFQESSMTRCTHEDSPYQLLYGRPHIYEQVLGFHFRISPDAFFQVNQTAAEVLYSKLRDIIAPKTTQVGDRKTQHTLLDVCCGTGAIGITLSPSVDQVIGIEVIEQAVEDATYNATFNGTLNCEFIPGKAEVVLPGLVSSFSSTDGSFTAVVNPSRAGLHYRVVRALRNQPAIRRLLYVSCKPEGEAMRNFTELCCAPNPQMKLEGKPFAPTLAVPVDMFPHTFHCELILLFER